MALTGAIAGLADLRSASVRPRYAGEETSEQGANATDEIPTASRPAPHPSEGQT